LGTVSDKLYSKPVHSWGITGKHLKLQHEMFLLINIAILVGACLSRQWKVKVIKQIDICQPQQILPAILSNGEKISYSTLAIDLRSPPFIQMFEYQCRTITLGKSGLRHSYE